MRLSILTAALQELTPRNRRERRPGSGDRGGWSCPRAALPNIELSAALHPTESDLPAAALLDPVANTLDLRQLQCGARIACAPGHANPRASA